ncbi:NUDIX hydrolase [Adhaeribacter soli]|nr:NUDIX domain-containing protein [Adhaeribacter soli]
MKEYLEIFDEHNQPTNQQLLRREVHASGHWHRTAQVYVFNYRNELLCNLRSPAKDLFPMLWDVSIGGHLAPGESYKACALRELGEELGLKPEPENLEFITTTKIDGQDKVAQLLDREHAGIFLYRTNLELADFNFQKEEIVKLQYLPLNKVKASLRAAAPEIQFIPLQQHYLSNLALIEQHL